MGKLDFIKSEISALESNGLLRALRVLSRPQLAPSHLIVDGREIVNFASNDYLGFSGDERVKNFVRDYLDKNLVGGTSSRLLAGTFDIHQQIEKALADFKKTEEALIFPSGYQTNLSVISALVGEGDCVITDKLNHASLIDAAKLSGAKLLVYPHCDVNEVEKILKRISAKGLYRRTLIITDALFSMDGDMAPLKELSALADRYEALLYVDEAHSTGIFGQCGRGVAEYLGVEEDKVNIKMGTLSKAIGSQGGFVCVSRELKSYLVNRARGFIYTTALAPVCVAAALKAIEIITSPEGARRREILLDKARRLRFQIKNLGFDTMKSVSQIIPIFVGDTQKSLSLSKRLLEKGIYAPAVRYPTVPKNSSRIRISLTAVHTDEDTDKLLEGLRQA